MRLCFPVLLSFLLLPGLAWAQEPEPASEAAEEAETDEPPVKRSGKMEVLVLGGGKTPEEAEAWMGHWKAASALMGNLVGLDEGFPRVMRSDEVAGLNPGFHIVVLGFCAVEERAAPFTLIKAFFPGTYAKAVTGQEESCPTGGSELPIEQHTVNLKKEGLRMAAVVTSSEEDAQAYIALFRGNTLLHHQSESYGDRSEGFPQSCTLRLKGTKARMMTEVACSIDATECNDFVTYYRNRTTYTVEGGKLEGETKELEERRTGYCD